MSPIKLGIAALVLLGAAVVAAYVFLLVPAERAKREAAAAAAAQAGVDPRLIGLNQRLTFTETAALSTFLGADDELPSPGLRIVYAAARAPAFAQTECVRLVETVAESCAVVAAPVLPASGDDRYAVTVELAFATGDSDLPEGAARRTIELGNVASDVQSGELAALRQDYYRLATDACEAERSAGNACLVENITIDQAESPFEEGVYSVAARAQIAVAQGQ